MKRRKLGRIPKTALLVLMAAVLTLTSMLSASAAPQPPFTKEFFGISAGAELTLLGEAQFDNQMNRMKKIGVHWVRAFIPWGLVQHDSPDDANWVLIDRLVNMVEAQGMELLGLIDLPPQWARRNVTPVTDCPEQPPFDLPAYAAFAAQVAARYGSARIAAIELENAPNLPGVWDKANPCAYTRLMQASYTAIKAVDPNIIVLTAGLGAQRNDALAQAGEVFLKNLYTWGAQGSFDVLSWHPYSYPCFPSGPCAKQRPWHRTSAVRQTMVDNGDADKQIWATEFGAPTGGTATDGHVDENNQAAMMVDGMKRWAEFPWAGPFFVFTYRDVGTDPTQKSDWFGLVSHNTKNRKLSYFTFQYEATGKTSVTIPPNVLAGVPHG